MKKLPSGDHGSWSRKAAFFFCILFLPAEGLFQRKDLLFVNMAQEYGADPGGKNLCQGEGEPYVGKPQGLCEKKGYFDLG